MNKFMKIKKALAVSVCSSMLFSGAPKTSGMNCTCTVNPGNNSISNCICTSTDSFGKDLGVSIGQASIWAFIAYIVNLGYNEICIFKDYYKAKKIYNKTCYFLNKLKDNFFSIEEKNRIRKTLKDTRNLILSIRNYSWFDCLFRVNKVSNDAQDSKNDLIKDLTKVIPDKIRGRDIKLGWSEKTKNPENSIDDVFDKMMELTDFNFDELKEYLINHDLPEFEEVLP